MPSLIPRAVRRYRREYPYSYPLLFILLDVFVSFVKLAALAAVLAAGYIFFKYTVATDRVVEATDTSQTNLNATDESQPKSLATVTGSNVKTEERTEISANQTATASTLVTADSPPQSNSIEIRRRQAAIDWVRQLASSDYIIQFAATPDENAILEFSREHLPSGAVVYPFKRTPSGRPIFGVASDSVFKSLEAAQEAIEKFPDALRQSKPWIRPAIQVKRAVSATVG